jgi:hypothetical protein
VLFIGLLSTNVYAWEKMLVENQAVAQDGGWEFGASRQSGIRRK